VVCIEPDTAVLLGLRKALNPFTPVADLVEDTDFVFRRSKKQWWMQMRPMMKILARHDSTYPKEKSKSLSPVHEHHEHHAEHC
jgi:6-phosphofructokinase 1